LPRLSGAVFSVLGIANVIIFLILGFGTASCSCQDVSLRGDTDADGQELEWPDFGSILQPPQNEEMPEFVMDADPHDLYSEDAPPEPWVPEFWDVDFDYLDVAADYEPDPEFCGNGVVDPGEECDDGNDDDNDACTGLCLFPRCGDGYAWYGMEDCDPPGTVRPCMTDCGSTGREWCMPFCRWEGACIPPMETCGNGVDDDCDGIVDTVVRLCPNLPVSDGPIGSRRSMLAWSSSEFLVMWASADGSTMLSRLDPWGRKTAWDWIVNRYFQGLGHLAWTGSRMGTFLGVPGYESDNDRYFSAFYLFFQALHPDGRPLSDFVALASSESTYYDMGAIYFASSESGHGVLFDRTADLDSDPPRYTYFTALSTDGDAVSGETLLGGITNWVEGGPQYGPCFIPTADGYLVLRRPWPANTYELQHIAPDGVVMSSHALDLTNGAYCVATGSGLALFYVYNNGNTLQVSFWGLDGTFLGSGEETGFFEDEGDDYAQWAMVGAGDEVGLFWTDTRDGNQELYFRRIGTGGEILAEPARLTFTAEPSRDPAPIWDGEAYALTWWDSDGLNEDIFFTRFSPCP